MRIILVPDIILETKIAQLTNEKIKNIKIMYTVSVTFHVSF